MKVNLLENIKIITKKTIIAYEINSIMLIPNESATISIFIYCDDNTLQEKTFMLSGKASDDYINDEYLYNYIDSHIKEIFINNYNI